MYATYQREYENFTHLPGESIDALFQRFTVVVNNMRANVDMPPHDDHDRAVKLLHSLDRTIWGGKFEAIMESEKYDTLTVNELFSKLKSTEVDRGITAKLEGPTDSHSLALVGRGIASGYAGYALAYPKNWQVNVAVKKKNSPSSEMCTHRRRKQCRTCKNVRA
jgi:hypothetical protein